MTSEPGTIEEFSLLRVLGSGGMGAVYLAHDAILDRQVALKLVRVGLTAEHRQRFLTEARAIARLSHPNVVTIYRAGTTASGVPFLAQELIEGQSLDRLSLPLDERRCVELALGIARGLAAAHHGGVLHRDIKPSNVMVDGRGIPRLLDFGVAKLMAATAVEEAEERSGRRRGERDARAGEETLAETADRLVEETGLGSGVQLPCTTADGTPELARSAVVGTPRYLAPELWRGEAATVQTDVYAFGVLLYELVTGRLPYPQAERESLRRAVVGGEAPAPLRAPGAVRPEAGRDPGSGLESSVSSSLDALILSCLSFSPSDRPASADELILRLERLLTGAPPLPPGNPYRGLFPFDAEHRALFFGRAAEVSDVVELLRHHSLVTLTGDSGVGKSSLARAGVLPAVAAGALADGRRWETRALRPAAAPSVLAELTAIVRPPDSALLLLLDQAEELLAASASVEELAEAVAALSGLPDTKMIVAVRGDFFTRVAALPRLGPLMVPGLYVVRELTAAALREAIVAPARLHGVRFESEAVGGALREIMIDELVAAAPPRAGGLPLLSFALAELWARRDPARALIPRAALDDIGGVAGALAGHADRVLAGLSAKERQAARRIILALVTEEGTRAVRRRDELLEGDAGDAADDGELRGAARALEVLVAGRLIAARDPGDGPPSYELAHESLIGAWSTLRGWLAEAAGQRGIRLRLGEVAARWHKRGQPRELLWSRAQLRAVASEEGLGAPERAFLTASRRAGRRKLLAMIGAAAAIPLAVKVTWAVISARADAVRDAEVARSLGAAAKLEAAAELAAGQARARREEAWALYDANQGSAGEEAWSASAEALGLARRQLVGAASQLERAVIVDRERADVERRMAEVLVRSAQLAEEAGHAVAVAELEQRLVTYDDGELLARWRQPILVELRAPGARQISLFRDLPGSSPRRLEPVLAVAGERLRAALSTGSYRAQITAAAPTGERQILYPFVVRRGQPRSIAVDLPSPDARLPDGFVFVPAGEMLTGSDDETFFRKTFLYTSPLRPATTASFLIARREVTFGEYLAYLRALPPELRAARTPPTLRLGGDGRYALQLEVAARTYRVVEDEALEYPGRSERRRVRWQFLPVSGVTLAEAAAYAEAMAQSGQIPGARLCRELEWERAARGADGRRYPHGDQLSPDEANIDRTYGQVPAAFGPDEVGSHPASDSPFGISDLAGNAYEWTLGAAGPVIRGGSWYQGASTALAANRDPTEPAMRSSRIGFRLCADP